MTRYRNDKHDPKPKSWTKTREQTNKREEGREGGTTTFSVLLQRHCSGGVKGEWGGAWVPTLTL